ncbi:ABC transporter ATP-binding protein [Fulvivirga sp. M361]|uniref:ABC transporter ATP-binding protein n=1 Tax=Fulvivirga sp. M361 TaxID=2594266 RepID=UPI00117BCA2C|nr:ABC transporter ATP-binding protein [Fulvivirga sp. M361]TRX48409.1 ABC transporter ATP-binding protein [Fulvivirga sp. M361]
MEILNASGIKKNYGHLEVLKGIDMSVEEGEVISIVGASGAGKSTLLHILGTLDTPDSGQLELKGKNVLRLRNSERARFRNDRIGFIFQFHNLLPEFTALENVCIPAYIQGQDTQKSKEKAQALLDLLGLSRRYDHKPSELSGGEQQRVAVARALVNGPSLVFADEPSGNLDSRNAKELHDLFFKLRDQSGHTFIIVTHNEEFANMADRKLEMQDGLIIS